VARLILVADDSPTIQKIALGILRNEGFEVETVSNGVAALKKLLLLQPDLVLADVSMPGKDGYEVCEYIKSSVDFHHVPVVLVASDLEPFDERKGAQVGADGIIKKPFSSHELIALVGKFVAQEEPAAQPDAVLPAAVETPLDAAFSEAAPEAVTRGQDRDWTALSSGMAFAEPQPDQMPAVEPAPGPLEIPLQPSSEPVLEAPLESVLGGPSESALERPPEALPAPALDLTPEPAPAAPESAAGTGLEVAPEPAAEATGKSMPEEARELVPEAGSELASATPEPVGEEVRLPAETVPEAPRDLKVDESSLPTGPILVEELMEAVPGRGLAHEHAEPAANTTMMFHTPAEILEPVLKDDLAPAPPPSTEEHPGHAASTSLDSFSLAEAWADQVCLAPVEAGPAAPEQTPEVAQPAEAPETAPSAIDAQWVHAIVCKAVTKMAPPVLSPEVVEELIRRLTEEITAELNAESSQSQ